MLDKFVSMRTRRPFKAMLAWDAEAGKVGFEFAPSKFPPRKPPAGKTPAAAKAAPAARKSPAGAAAKSAAPAAAKKVAAKKTPARKVVAKKAAAPAKVAKVAKTGTLQPSAELAAVIGEGLVARTEVVRKIWDYIKAQGLQDAKNKRAINADAKLQKVFGKPQVTMFELAGLIGKHLS